MSSEEGFCTACLATDHDCATTTRGCCEACAATGGCSHTTPEPSEVAETTAGEREHMCPGAAYCDAGNAYPTTADEREGEVEALDRDEWCICSTEFRAEHGDAHTRLCRQHWGDLAALLDRVRREEGAKVLREAADTFAWAGGDEDYRAFRDWLNARAASVGPTD